MHDPIYICIKTPTSALFQRAQILAFQFLYHWWDEEDDQFVKKTLRFGKDSVLVLNAENKHLFFGTYKYCANYTSLYIILENLKQLEIFLKTGKIKKRLKLG